MASHSHAGYSTQGGSVPTDPDAPTASYPPIGQPPVAPPPVLGSSSGDAHNAPTAVITTAASGDRCNNCGAPLASDQRYCVNCGERRGRARFSTEVLEAPRPEPAIALREPVSPRGRGLSAATLIAGVATLLVAMGVGVLIGHDSAGTKQPVAAAQTKPINITVNGGGSGTSTGSGSGSSSSTNSSSSKHSKTATTKAPPIHVSQAAIAKGASQANKVLGGASKSLAPSTVQQGGACTGGAGCQNGKFNGNFFGGG